MFSDAKITKNAKIGKAIPFGREKITIFVRQHPAHGKKQTANYGTY